MFSSRPAGFSEMSNESYIYIIAEIGINHNGSLNLAKKLIDMAKDCGFTAVKFQKRNPEISTPSDQKTIFDC